MILIKPGAHRLFENDPETARVVSEMLTDLEKNGMEAVRRYSSKFDDWNPDSFELSEEEIRRAISSLPEQAIADTDYCQSNVRAFARAQLETMRPLETEIRPGVILGHKHIPVNAVGSYIPGGRYPMFGSAQMSIIPAKVAGVKTVVACTPPTSLALRGTAHSIQRGAAGAAGRCPGGHPASLRADGSGSSALSALRGTAHSTSSGQAGPASSDAGQAGGASAEDTSDSTRYYAATINAIRKAGADRIFIVGGVPALAMMALGIGDVEPVDILCGAGNKYVTEAKRQLFGRCGIDLLAGPTEILVIADDAADPALVACDILGQAEHDPNSGICLITLSEDFARKTIAEVEKQLETLPTRDVASVSWANNGIVYAADSPEEAVALSDDYAPEHLELHVRDQDFFFDNLTNYGSLFIGEETTVAYGDKSIGTNHILPTSRAARYTGGVWVGKFLKTCTYQRMTPAASREVGEVTERQCNLEHMLAHGITARVRVERYGGSG